MYNKDTTDSVVRQLKSMPDIPCDVNPDVTEKDMMDALLKHCERSYNQAKDLCDIVYVSERNKKKLKELIDEAGYTNMSFWIPPRFDVSADVVIAELVNCFENIKKEKENGTWIADNTSDDFIC